MKKKLLVLGLVMALLLSLAGCGSSAPAAGDAAGALPDQSLSQEPAPEEPESEPASPEPEQETPGEKTVSIYLHQDQLTFNGPTPVWELTLEDEEELALVAELLSTENLVPASEDEAMWPDGGTFIDFEIDYEDHTVSGSCNPRYVYRGDDYSNLWSEEDQIFYRYPQKTGDALMAFLESKGITVSG